MRGSIAERSGIRVGHRIIEINGTSTVGMQHAETVHLLSSTVGDVSAGPGRRLVSRGRGRDARNYDSIYRIAGNFSEIETLTIFASRHENAKV